MLSMPPATTISELPVWIACCASATAFSPEPQTLLMVIALTLVRQATAERGLPRRILAQPGRDNVAHDAFVDAVGIDAGALHGFAHDDGAQLRRGEIGKRALKFADRSAHCRYDDNVF